MFRILDNWTVRTYPILNIARGVNSITLISREISKNPRMAMRSKIDEYAKLMRFNVKILCRHGVFM